MKRESFVTYLLTVSYKNRRILEGKKLIVVDETIKLSMNRKLTDKHHILFLIPFLYLLYKLYTYEITGCNIRNAC